MSASLWTGSLFGEKNSKEREGKGGERACRQTFEAAIPPSCNYLAEHLSVRSLSVNQFRKWVTPGKINGKWAVFCSVSKQSEMDREPNCRFCKKSLISGKRINTVPVVGVSRNKTLLVDSGQDSVVLAQAFESSRFLLEQGESFSDLSCLTCARRAVRLASSVSNLTLITSELGMRKVQILSWVLQNMNLQRQVQEVSSARSPTGITPLGIYPVFIAIKRGGRPTRLLPHAKMLPVPILFSSVG